MLLQMVSKIRGKRTRGKASSCFALPKSKQGISIMIGYVLLVSIAIIMGGVMYTWMKSYVPSDSLECPEGTSLIIKSYEYNCSSQELNITLKNNGRFDIGGYFVHASDNLNQTVANIDLSQALFNTGDVYKYKSAVLISQANKNAFNPNNETTNIFNVSTLNVDNLTSIEITPVRWQRENNKLRFVSCGTISRFKENINCQ